MKATGYVNAPRDHHGVAVNICTGGFAFDFLQSLESTLSSAAIAGLLLLQYTKDFCIANPSPSCSGASICHSRLLYI